MNKVYGYCRISTRQQNIERQVRNILSLFPNACIIKEVFTGTKTNERKEWSKLSKAVKNGDTIIFDSVSRMSRDSGECSKTYKDLYNGNINLIFLKEPHINTEVYKQALDNKIPMIGDDVDILLKAVNEYLMKLVERQIQIAFEQAEKEVTDLRKRTSEGLLTAKMNGKQIGRVAGQTITTKKEVEAKEIIKKHSKSFGGTLSDGEVIKLIGISRNSYYKYKRILVNEGV